MTVDPTADRWPAPLTEPAAPTVTPEPPTVRVEVPGVEDALLVGPGDVLALRVATNVSPSGFRQMAADLEVGPLAGRVLLIAAADGCVLRPGSAPGGG